MKRVLIFGLLLGWSAITPAAVIKTIQAGATDQTVVIKIIDSADGTPETGVVFNTSGIDLEYWRHGANAVTDITEATQTVNGAHADGGFVHLGNGYYRLDLPDAAVATGVTAVEVMGTVTGMIVIGGTVQLSTDTPQTGDSFARLGAPAGASVSADIVTLDNFVDDLESRLGTPSNLGGGATLAANAADIEAQTDDIGVAGAGLTNIDLPNQTMDITGTISTVTSVTNMVTANATQFSGDSAVVDRLEAILDGTCGSYPELGITRGVGCTAQAYTAGTPSLTLDASAAFGDNTLEGATILICGSTQGYCQPATAVSNVGSTDVVTLREALPVAATGTITYTIFGTSTASGDVNVTTIEGTDATTVLGTAQTGDAYARLGAPAGASVSADIAAVKSDSAAILVDTSTTLDDLVDDLESRLGTPSNLGGGATVAANLSDIEGQTDDIGAAGAGLTAADDAVMTRIGAPVGASISADIAGVESGISWNSAWDAEVESEANDAIVTNLLDRLLLNTYDPASPPGAADSLLEDLVENDAGVTRFSVNALEQGPSGGGGVADWTADERTAIRAILGIPGSGTTPADPTTGIMDTIRDFVDTEVATLVTNVGAPTNLGSGASLAANMVDVEGQTDDIGAAGAGLSAADDAVMTRLGAPAGASIAADVAAIEDQTDDIGVAGAGLTAADDAVMSRLGTPAGASVSDDVAAIESQTDDIGVAGAGLTAADDAVIAAIAALNNLSANQVRDLVIEDQGGGVSLGCALAVLLAYASGDIVTSGTTTTYEEPSGTETRTTGTVASAGNRTATITCPTY